MNYVSYLLHVGVCLQGCVLSVLFESVWWLSASYMKQVGGCLLECVRTLSDNSGRMAIICQLHEAGWRLSVSYMKQDDGYLSVT